MRENENGKVDEMESKSKTDPMITLRMHIALSNEMRKTISTIGKDSDDEIKDMKTAIENARREENISAECKYSESIVSMNTCIEEARFRAWVVAQEHLPSIIEGMQRIRLFDHLQKKNVSTRENKNDENKKGEKNEEATNTVHSSPDQE